MYTRKKKRLLVLPGTYNWYLQLELHEPEHPAWAGPVLTLPRRLQGADQNYSSRLCGIPGNW